MRLRNQYVASGELALFQADPGREAKLAWTIVVCRECGQKRASIPMEHLKKAHELDQKTYHAKWPGAPMLTPAGRLAADRAALKWSRNNAEQHRANTARWRHDSKNRAKIKAQGQRANQRRHADPEPHRAYDRIWYAKKKIPKATEAELIAFQKHPSSVPYVVCLEPNCRAKLRDIGCAHITKIHGFSPEAYIKKYPGMPTKALKNPSHRPKGSKAKDTADRIIVVANCQLQGLKPYKITPHAYPLQHRKATAWRNTQSFLLRNDAAIRERAEELSKLSPVERAALVERAKRELRTAY